MKVLMHVQHLLGIGHQRRAAAIARALDELSVDVVYVSGGMPVANLALGRAEHVQLPPARTGDLRYSHLIDERGEPVDDDWRERRRTSLLRTLESERPDVLLLETYPFGRKLLAFELEALLEAARRMHPRPQIWCSLRDIVEPRSKPARYERMLADFARYFDGLLVHSDPGVLPLDASFPVSDALRARLWYTGFVAEEDRPVQRAVRGVRENVALISAGGGAVGAGLVYCSMTAQRLSRRESTFRDTAWWVMRGQRPSRGYRPAVRQAKLRVEPNRPDFPRLLERCRVSVSQAGYNTVMDLLRARCPAVLVPYAQAGQREQTIRAHALARMGLGRVIPEAALNPRRLLREMRMAEESFRPLAARVDFSGAATSARILAGLKCEGLDGGELAGR